MKRRPVRHREAHQRAQSSTATRLCRENTPKRTQVLGPKPSHRPTTPCHGTTLGFRHQLGFNEASRPRAGGTRAERAWDKREGDQRGGYSRSHEPRHTPLTHSSRGAAPPAGAADVDRQPSRGSGGPSGGASTRGRCRWASGRRRKRGDPKTREAAKEAAAGPSAREGRWGTVRGDGAESCLRKTGRDRLPLPQLKPWSAWVRQAPRSSPAAE